MKLPILFGEEAESEFESAKEWYEVEARYGAEFKKAVDEAIDLIAESPFRYSEVYRGVRRLIVKRFPYGVFYRVHLHHIKIIAIFHLHRDPRIWKSRK